MIRRLFLPLFAFAVLSLTADDLIYYAGVDDYGCDMAGYAYAPSFSDVASNLFPDWHPSDGGSLWLSPDECCFIMPVSPDQYNGWLSDGANYHPFSSDPAYASSTPSGPPSGGGNGEGGFDPVGSLSGLSSFMSGLSSAVLGVFGVACFVFLSFIAWRKFRYSSKRV